MSGLFAYIQSSMPPGNAGSLGEAEYAALSAFILHENGGVAPAALTSAMESLASLALPGAAPITENTGEMGRGGISLRYKMCAPPPRVDRFADYTPVTERHAERSGARELAAALLGPIN